MGQRDNYYFMKPACVLSPGCSLPAQPVYICLERCVSALPLELCQVIDTGAFISPIESSRRQEGQGGPLSAAGTSVCTARLLSAHTMPHLSPFLLCKQTHTLGEMTKSGWQHTEQDCTLCSQGLLLGYPLPSSAHAHTKAHTPIPWSLMMS